MSEERWQEQFSDDPELRDSPVLANFKTPADAMKGLVELKAYQGRSIGLPGDDATPQQKADVVEKLRKRGININLMPNEEDQEDVARFWKELGVPDDVDGYAPPVDAGDLPEELEKQLKVIAKKSKMTKQQYQDARDYYATGYAEQQEQQAQLIAEDESKLKRTWGGAYEQNMGITNEMVKQFQDPDAPLRPLTLSERLFMLNVAKSVTSKPQVFDQIRNPDKAKKSPAELRADVEDMRVKLLDRSVTGQRRKTLLKRYGDAFDELARYQ